MLNAKKNEQLVGNKGSIELLGDNNYVAYENNSTMGVAFQGKDLPKWIEKLEIVSTDNGGIKLGEW